MYILDNMKLKTRVIAFLLSLWGTFLLFRIALYLMPFNNFDLLGYNIHHIFTGSIILMISIVAFVFEFKKLIFVVLAGIGSALILDEVVYLITTAGTDLDYLKPISWIGALILMTLMTLSILLLSFFRKSSNPKL